MGLKLDSVRVLRLFFFFLCLSSRRAWRINPDDVLPHSEIILLLVFDVPSFWNKHSIVFYHSRYAYCIIYIIETVCLIFMHGTNQKIMVLQLQTAPLAHWFGVILYYASYQNHNHVLLNCTSIVLRFFFKPVISLFCSVF